jgi:hypothetical protein
MVTAGANQAFTNLVCTLLDAEDAAVLFSPYYFNHLMALQVRIDPVWRHPVPLTAACRWHSMIFITCRHDWGAHNNATLSFVH